MLHLGAFCFSGTPEDCCRDFAWMVYLECLQWSATFLLVEARRKEQDLSTFLMISHVLVGHFHFHTSFFHHVARTGRTGVKLVPKDMQHRAYHLPPEIIGASVLPSA